MDFRDDPTAFLPFFDGIPLRIFAKGRDGRYIYGNDAFAVDFGLSTEEIPGKTDFDLFPEAMARKILEDDEIVMNRGIDMDIVEEARHSSLGGKVLRIMKRPTRNPDGTISGMMGILWEVSGEEKNRKALEESKRRLRMTLEATGIGISRYDVRKEKFIWDDQCSRIYGVAGKNESDLSGFLKILAPEDRDMVAASFEKFLVEKQNYNGEFRIIWPDGSLRYILVRGEWTTDADGESPAPTYINMDITHRRRSEEALKSLLELNRSVSESSFDEILEKGLEEAVRLTSSRIGFLHLVDEENNRIELKKWSRETMAMCDVPDLSAHYPVPEAGIWADCIRERRPIIHNDYASAPGRKGLPEGHFPLVRELVVPLFEGDRIVAVIGVGNKPREYGDFEIDQMTLIGDNILNVAKKKQAYQKLEEAHEKAVKDNKVKDRFFSLLAHDLTNPVSNIRILADQVSMLANSEVPEQDTLREIARILGDSVETAQSLLADLLTWSRSQRNAIEFTPESIDAEIPAAKAVESCEAVAAGKGIGIEKDYTAGTTAFMDANMMQTVLRNLLMNAVKFTPRGGKVTMAMRSEADRIVYTVRDNGIGIPEDRMKTLFSLEGVRSTRGTESEKGTGLGLILCKEFVEKHGGEISAESTVGEGTAITVSIPAAPAEG